MDEQEEFEFRLRAEQEKSAAPPEFMQRLAAEQGQVQGQTPSIGGVVADLAKQPLYAMRNMNVGVRQALGDFLGDERMQKSAQDEAAEMKYQQQAYAPKFESDTAQGLYSGVQSLARQGPALAAGIATGGAALPLIMLGADTGSEAYTKYRGRGAEPGMAAVGAAGEAGTEIATEMLPMGFLIKKFGKVGLGQFLTGMLAREVPSEQVATLVQDAIDTAIANPDKTWGDYLKERPGAAYQTLLATVAQGGLMAGGSKAVQKYREYKGKDKEVENVNTKLDAIDQTKTEAIKSQGTTTMYVGQDGTASTELGTQITDAPGVVDLARAQNQDQLGQGDPKKYSYWEPNQMEMFDPVSGPHYPDQKSAGQLSFDLKTPTDGLPPEPPPGGGTPGAATYELAPEDPRPRARAALKEQAEMVRLTNEARVAREKGDTVLAESLDKLAAKAKTNFELLSKEFKETSEANAISNANKPSFIPDVKEVKSWAERLMEIAHNPPDFLNPVERAKWQRDQIKLEREWRSEWFNDYAQQIIPDQSIIQPDGTVDIRTLLETIINDPEVAAMRKPLATLAKDLAPYLMDLRVTVVNSPLIESGGQDVPGFYNTPEHRIFLGKDGWTVRIIMHELVHAATARAVNAVIRKDGNYTTKAPEALKQLTDIMELLRAKADPLADGWYLNGGKIYGLSDIREFVAEVMTNRYLQGIMKEMPAFKGVKSSSNNLFTRFLQGVKDLLGIKKNMPSATLLDQAVDLTGALVEWQGQNSKFINSAIKQAFPSWRAAELNPPKPDALSALANAPTQKGVKALERATLIDGDSVKANVLDDVAGVQYVAKDPKVDEALIDKISKEKDGSDLWAITPGGLARALDSGSTLVMTGYRLLDNAAKRTAYLTKQLIAPVEQSIVKLLQSEEKGSILHNIFMRELRNKNDYTADELRAAGVSDDVILAHLEFRNMMDQVLARENLARADKGLEPVDRLQSFLTARWSGPWRANIRDSEGKIVWQIAEQSRRQANKALQYILAQDPSLKADDISYKQGLERSDSVEAGYNEMLKLLDPDDPRTKVLQSIHEEYILGKTEDVAQQEKHFMRKTGVRGYAGDRPWSKEDYKDFFVQQFAYAKNGLKWSEYQTAVDKLKPLISDPKLKDSQKNNIAYLKEYSKLHLGFGTLDAFNKIDNFLAKTLGTSPDSLQSAMGAAKSYFYLTRLGLSIPFTITQFIQPAITTPAWHTKLTTEGYKHNPVNTAVMGTVNGVGASMWHYIKLLGGDPSFVEQNMDALDKDAVRWMEANGIVEINQLADIKRDLRPQSVKMLAYPFEFTIKHSETIARSIAFMSFVQHLKQSGKFDLTSAKGKAELFQKAEDMTKVSMVDYRTTERAMFFERGGLTGDAAATLHSYQFNNLFQMWHFMGEAKKGNPRPLLTMAFMQFVAAGTMGLWFIDDLDDAFENMKKMFLSNEQYAKWNKIGIKSFILEHFTDFFAYGGVSKIGGTNMHTRLTAANQIPIWPFESVNVNTPQGFAKSLGDMAGAAAPFAGTTGNLLGAVADQIPGRNIPAREKWESAYAAAPAVAQGPMESLPAFNAGGVSKSPSDLGKGVRRRTEYEKDLRNFGLRSTAEQRQKDKEWGNTKIEMELQRRMNRASEKATKHILDGNNRAGVKEIIDYVSLGGEPQTILNNLPKNRIREVTTELERRSIEAGSGSRASILKLKRYIDNVGVQ